MDFLKSIGRTVNGAVQFVGEKNRRAAQLNRLRAVIRCEEQAAQREYLALGRYYYNNCRNRDNAITEPHCAELEGIEGRLDAAIAALERFYANEGTQEDCCRKNCCDSEEVTLDDVQELESSPLKAVSESGAVEVPVPEAVSQEGDEPLPVQQAAEQDENARLPFEG